MLLLFTPSAELPEWFVAVAGVCYAAIVLGVLFLILRLIFRGLFKRQVEVRYVYVEKGNVAAQQVSTARKPRQKVVRIVNSSYRSSSPANNRLLLPTSTRASKK